jgi:hypothetical protein
VAIEDVLLRVSWLVAEVPSLAERDRNPVMAPPAGQGLASVDARIRLRP